MHFQKVKVVAAAAAAFFLLLTSGAADVCAQSPSASSGVVDNWSAAQTGTTAAATVAVAAQSDAPPETAAIKSQPPQTSAHAETLRPAKEDDAYQAAFGFNYPGANIKMFLSGGFAAELKGQYIDKIGVGGLRLYLYNGAPVRGGERLKFFGGVELDYISFKGKLSKGAGVAAEAFAGMEMRILNNVSLQADIGPAYISVTDKATSLSANGLEFVINSGVNFYF